MRSISMSWELDRNINSQALLLSSGIRNSGVGPAIGVLTALPGNSGAHWGSAVCTVFVIGKGGWERDGQE